MSDVTKRNKMERNGLECLKEPKQGMKAKTISGSLSRDTVKK
jgi:hypothetical protein